MSNPKSKLDGSVPKVVESKYIVELKSCQRYLNNVTCTFTVTNGAAEERTVRLSGAESKIFDETGNEYSGIQAVLGGKINRTTYIGAYNTLVSQVPMKASIKFENVSPGAKLVTLLISAKPAFRVTLRNVEIN